MHISEQGLALIRRFEGFSPTPYRCPAGVMTIGYGHTARAGASLPERISHAEAEALLAEDSRRALAALKRHIPQKLEQHQVDALVSFIYNVGAGAFARSTLRKVLARGWMDEAPGEMMRWVHAGGKKLPGLVARRAAEVALFRGY